ncbi:hypothetical protein GOODEAATRI_030335, partial [Goodea atripinnis]
KERTYPELDEEIDFLSAIISEQRTESRMPAPPSQYFKLKKLIEPSSVHRGFPTEQPTSLSNLLNTTTPPSTTNHTPGLLSDPLIIAYPSNDHVFIIMSSVFIAVGSLALIIAGVCWVRSRDEPRIPDSGASTDEENEDGDFTVYECPGLAPTGEMEVKNPLFDDSNLNLQRFHK